METVQWFPNFLVRDPLKGSNVYLLASVTHCMSIWPFFIWKGYWNPGWKPISSGSGRAVVNVCQELPAAAGGIGGPTHWALQESIIQEVGDFRGRCGTMRVTDSKTLKLQAAVGAGLWETAVWLFLKHRKKKKTSILHLIANKILLKPFLNGIKVKPLTTTEDVRDVQEK